MFDLYDKYEYKIDYLTIKKCIDLNLTSCKYISDLHTTRFKKSQLIKYPTTKDIIEYNYGENISKYYVSDKNFIIMINKKGVIVYSSVGYNTEEFEKLKNTDLSPECINEDINHIITSALEDIRTE